MRSLESDQGNLVSPHLRQRRAHVVPNVGLMNPRVVMAMIPSVRLAKPWVMRHHQGLSGSLKCMYLIRDNIHVLGL